MCANECINWWRLSAWQIQKLALDKHNEFNTGLCILVQVSLKKVLISIHESKFTELLIVRNNVQIVNSNCAIKYHVKLLKTYKFDS